MTARHVVRSLRLEVETGSEETALALQPHLGDIGREHLWPAIERVFDRLDQAGRHVRLDRLTLDLGLLPLDGFAKAAADALGLALEESLVVRLGAPDDGDDVRDDADSELDLLGHYLGEGVLPYWAGDGRNFSLVALVGHLAETQPAALAALVIRHGHRRTVLERLAWQLGDDGLRRLLTVLDPENAVLILAYLLDLRETHGRQPVVALGEADLWRLLWVLTLSWEVRDPGSQFNRKSFVQSLLQGLAADRSVDYAALVLTLHRGLALVSRRRQSAASLPAVVRELARELGMSGDDGGAKPRPPADAGPSSTLAALERYLRGRGGPDPRGLVAELATSDPAGLSALVRRLGRQTGAAALLVERLGEALLRRLLMVLEPDSAVVILVYLSEIGAAHRAEPLIQATAERLRHLLWLLTLTFEANDAGSRFNRKSYLRSLLAGLAEAEGVDYAGLVATLQRGLEQTERRLNPAAALPAVIGELAQEIARTSRDPLLPSAEALYGDLAWALGMGEPLGAGLSRLADLMERNPDQARRLIWRLAETPMQAGLLVQALGETGPLAGRVMTLLRPGDAALLTALTQALEKLPAALAPRLPPASALLALVLELGDGGNLTAERLRGLLRRLFGDPPPLPVRRSLRRRLALWRAAGSPPPAQLTALAQALGEKNVPAEAEEEQEDGPPPPPVQVAPDHRGEVLAVLAGDAPLDSDTLDHMLALLRQGDAVVSRFLATHLGDAQMRRSWAELLPPAVLLAVTDRLAPHIGGDLARGAALLVTSWRQAAGQMAVALPDQAETWRFLLDYLAATPPDRRSVAGLSVQFQTYLSERAGTAADRLGRAVATLAARAAEDAGDAALASVLAQTRPEPPPASVRPAAPPTPTPEPSRTPPASTRGRTAFAMDDEDDQSWGEPIYLQNAGLALAGPFLPHLFARLKWLENDADGKSILRPAKLSRAVQLLQWLVDERTDHPEPLLVLNKLLCGVDAAVPVVAGLRLSRTEKATGLSLLQGMIGNWTVISNTSVPGLRETFLQRDGKLQRGAGAWRLTVQRKVLDVLVDRVPWTISVIKHPWMKLPLYVNW